MAMIKGHHFPNGKTEMPKAKSASKSANIPQVGASPGPNRGGESVDIRPIDNGYLIEKRMWRDGPKGYKSDTKTIYSPTKPKIGV